jgi:hypothetical protein
MLAGVSLPRELLAADSEAGSGGANSAASLAESITAAGIAVSGYISASYYHSSGDNTFHEFDTKHDTFQLDQAALSVGFQPKSGFGAFVDVLAGEDAKILNQAENGNEGSFNVRQAYLQYATGSLTFIGGKFTTLAGAEYSNPILNPNFSRSLLFYAEPLTHTGVRATWAASDTLNLIAGVNNGWNTTSSSYGPKTVELGAAFTPNKRLALYLQGYFGKEPDFDAQRSFVDFVGNYSLTDALSFILSIDWGRQQQNAGPDLDWDGVAAYANYAISSRWRVSVRVEYLNDKGGFVTGTSQKLREGTLTFGFTPTKNFELWMEARYDKSNQATFVNYAPPTASVPAPETFSSSQREVAVMGAFKF